MTQGIFDFQYEVEKRSAGMTGLAVYRRILNLVMLWD
jgi:hypothetical protein